MGLAAGPLQLGKQRATTVPWQRGGPILTGAFGDPAQTRAKCARLYARTIHRRAAKFASEYCSVIEELA